MPFYIAPFDGFDYYEVSEISSGNYMALFYKGEDYGLSNNNSISKILFRFMLGKMWYDVKNLIFETITQDNYESRRFNLKGLLFLDIECWFEHIENGILALKSMKKNELLKRYNKDLLKTGHNIILNSYPDSQYTKSGTAKILGKGNAIIIHTDGYFGSYFIFDPCLKDYIVKWLRSENQKMIEVNELSALPD